MQKTANDHVFFPTMGLSVGFYRQRHKFLSQQGKKAQARLAQRLVSCAGLCLAVTGG